MQESIFLILAMLQIFTIQLSNFYDKMFIFKNLYVNQVYYSICAFGFALAIKMTICVRAFIFETIQKLH